MRMRRLAMSTATRAIGALAAMATSAGARGVAAAGWGVVGRIFVEGDSAGSNVQGPARVQGDVFAFLTEVLIEGRDDHCCGGRATRRHAARRRLRVGGLGGGAGYRGD